MTQKIGQEKKLKEKSYVEEIKTKFPPIFDPKQREKLEAAIQSQKHQPNYDEFIELGQKVKKKRRYEGISIQKMKERQMKLEQL